MNPGWYLPFLLTLFLLISGCTSTSHEPGDAVSGERMESYTPLPEHSAALSRFTDGVNSTLHSMDANLVRAAIDLGSTGIAGEAANATLDQLMAQSPHARDVVTITPDGRIVAVRPEKYQAALGAYVGNQSHNMVALQEQGPLLSQVFPAVEGFEAVVIARPVRNETGTFLGVASLVIAPFDLIGDCAETSLPGMNFTAWAIDGNGRILYEGGHSMLSGLSILTDPAFAGSPELVELAKRITVEPAGSGQYVFRSAGDGQPAAKDAAWATVGLHGTEWRLIVARDR